MSKEVNIGICAFPLDRGLETGRGLERVVEEFCKYLDAKNIKYSFLSGGLIRNEFIAVLSAIKYIALLCSKSYEVYFAIYPVAAIFPLLLKRKPIVTAVHDLIPLKVKGFDNRLKYWIKSWTIRFACQKSDLLITPFQSTKEEISILFDVPSEKIKVVAYGVDHDKYFFSELVTKKDHISFLGEAKRAKGMDTAILAFKKILQQYPDFKLILASNGNELQQMKHLADQNIPADKFEFIGFVPEEKMRDFYSNSKVFIFPSRYGFGLSSLEAMACGTPVVISNTLDAQGFLDDPEIMEDPENIDGFADKISSLLGSESKYKEKLVSGLSRSKKFSWELMSREWYLAIVSQIK